jgi:hypothetical protein
MARIRSIKPEFWTDDKIVSLPYVVRLFFIGLWNFADDYGALPDKPEQLKLLIMPSEKDMDIDYIIDLLSSVGLIDLYIDEESDYSYLQIKNWTPHQKVDHPAKSKLISGNAKKVSVPALVRKKLAEKYGCKQGESKEIECYFCGSKGHIHWSRKMGGLPGSWIGFTHEISHLVPESNGGATNESNLVLACRNCNRSMGVRHAFDWLFNGVYKTNQTREVISTFREASRGIDNYIESSGLRGEERRGEGKEGKGEDMPAPENLMGVVIFDIEDFLLKRPLEFESAIMVKPGMTADFGKEILKKYHLWLKSKEQYPKHPSALIAGFQTWILNEKKHNNGSSYQRSNQQAKPIAGIVTERGTRKF